MLESLVKLAQQSLPPELVEACGDDPEFVCREVFEATDNDFLAKAAEWAVAKPLVIAFVFFLAWLANRLIRRAVRRFVAHAKDDEFQHQMSQIRRRTGMSLLDTGPVTSARRAQRAEAIGAVLRSLSSFVIYTLAAFVSLGELGLNLGPLIAGAGIVGVALGFGAQSLVKDFLSGIFMLIEDQFGVGDVIDAGPAVGEVEGISLRATRVRDVEGTLWHIPNGEMTRVGNKSQQWARVLLDVEVAYDTDIDEAKRVIKEVADSTWRDEAQWGTSILEEPEIWGIESLGASGIAIRLVVKTKPGEQWNLSRELRGRIKQAFDEAGIEIPFPQRTIWHRLDGSEASGGRPPGFPDPDATATGARDAAGEEPAGPGEAAGS